MDSNLPRLRLIKNGDVDSDISYLFDKKYQFRFNESWKLPEKDCWFSTLPWKVKELDVLKSRLNFHKSQLNDFNIEEWSSHTRRRNPAGEVGWKIRCTVNPEFLTQAWTKFYECAFTYNVVPREAVVDNKMVSLHLCEAPGAFITSLNHYLKLNHPGLEWKWVANTLNPYYEGNSPSNMISDDRFMFHTLDNWDFGADNTGNLMDWDNSQALVTKARSLGKVQLVTADGSIDCMHSPDAQEEATSPLHYCEIVTALQALSPGGTFIFKLFTLFEHSTVSLLYLINYLFGKVNIYKPVTSREGNSEVYAICLKYKGNDILKPYIPVLTTAYGSEHYGNTALFPLEAIPESFLKQIHECAYYFCAIQCQVINNNLKAYIMQKNISLHRDMKKFRTSVAIEFIKRYQISTLLLEHEILKGVLHEECKTNMNPRFHRGSYTERQLYTKMSSKEKYKNLNTLLAEVLSNPLILLNQPVVWLELLNVEGPLHLVFTYGRPLQKINSTKFIFVPIFRLYQQILAEDEFKEMIFCRDYKPCQDEIKNIGVEINKVLSFSEYDYSESYSVYEKKCFERLYKVLKELSLGETLLIQNFNMLTHFNVSLLFILSTKCFEMTGFTSFGIILRNLVDKESVAYFDKIEKECTEMKSDDAKDVLNSLPVQTTNAGVFFDNVVLYNNTFYRNKCTEYLFAIERSL